MIISSYSIKKLNSKLDNLIKTLNGGEGSGNFGHGGRPGEVGGSTSKGGSGSKSSIVEKGGIEKGYLEASLDKFSEEELSKLAKNPIANLSEKRLKEVASMRKKMYSTEEDFDRVMDLNVKGVFNTTRAAAECMVARGSGVILSTSSMVSVVV